MEIVDVGGRSGERARCKIVPKASTLSPGFVFLKHRDGRPQKRVH